jgi:hypothetical protein
MRSADAPPGWDGVDWAVPVPGVRHEALARNVKSKRAFRRLDAFIENPGVQEKERRGSNRIFLRSFPHGQALRQNVLCKNEGCALSIRQKTLRTNARRHQRDCRGSPLAFQGDA